MDTDKYEGGTGVLWDSELDQYLYRLDHTLSGPPIEWGPNFDNAQWITFERLMLCRTNHGNVPSTFRDRLAGRIFDRFDMLIVFEVLDSQPRCWEGVPLSDWCFNVE